MIKDWITNTYIPTTATNMLFFEPYAQKLTVNYTGGESFHVKRPRDIQLIRTKGGRIDLVYTDNRKFEAPMEYGHAEVSEEVVHTIQTGDIESIVVDEGVGSNGLRIKRVVEV